MEKPRWQLQRSFVEAQSGRIGAGTKGLHNLKGETAFYSVNMKIIYDFDFLSSNKGTKNKELPRTIS